MLVLAVTILALSAACKSDSSEEGGAPATTPATAAATPGPTTPSGIPARPTDFAAYAPTIAAYLTAHPEAGTGDACLNELFLAWDMPYYSSDRSCRAGNTDLDPEDEVAVVLAAPRAEEFAHFDYDIVVLDRDSDGYIVAYQAGIGPFLVPADNELGNVIVTIDDINGDGIGEFVYNRPSCGAHTCFARIFIVSGRDGAYTALAPGPSNQDPEGGISMSFADYRIEDVDGDGTKEIVLHGGSIGSVGAGPNRERTETWGWDGTRYILRETALDPPTFLYHAILDANALLDASRFAEAEAAFLAAIADPALDRGGSFSGSPNNGAELEAYAYLRAAVAHLLAGSDPATAIEHLDRAAALEAPLHAPLAAAFRDAYTAAGDPIAACDAVRSYINSNLDALTEFWNFGYGNPPFDPEAFCPFRPQ
jgi:hypothetical protein